LITEFTRYEKYRRHLIAVTTRTKTSSHRDHCSALVTEIQRQCLLTHRPATVSYSSCPQHDDATLRQQHYQSQCQQTSAAASVAAFNAY